MKLQFTTVDVFTDRPFGGNPLAVVTNAQGVSTERMQAIAADASGEMMLKAMQPFNLADLKNPSAVVTNVRAEEQLWESRGKDNIVRIIPEAWQRGWQEMQAAGLANAGDPSRAFTTAFSDKL